MRKPEYSITGAIAAAWLLAASPALAADSGMTLYSDPSATMVTKTTRTQVLTQDDILAVQSALKSRDFNPGPLDGVWGPQTAGALLGFQLAEGLPLTALPTAETAAALGVTLAPAVAGADRPELIEPAAGGPELEITTVTTDTVSTRTGRGFDAVNTSHVNGAACMYCTNGIIGNGSTPSMRSNEY